MKKYTENLYKIMFEFNFDGIEDDLSLRKSIITLTVSSLFLFMAKHTSGFSSEFFFLAEMIMSVFGVLFVWFITGVFFSFVALIFDKSKKLKKLLVLSGYSLLPYLLMAPFELMKKFSDIGYFWGTKFEILLFFWVIIIYAHSLAKTYNLEKTSSYMFVFLPLISLFFAFIWLIGSIFNLGYIYSV
ncbi:MAG: YIP1 family protein [Candidatus Gastranaerophilaceae bacterium]